MISGQPEFLHTPVIESTSTGPLGQGVANAIGLTASPAKMAAAFSNTAGDHKIIDHHLHVIAQDDCVHEDVTSNTACFTAHEKLDNRIVLSDATEVTLLDKMAEFTPSSEDIIKHNDAYRWEIFDIDNQHGLLNVVKATIAAAKENNNGKSKFILSTAIIDNGMEEIAETHDAHDEATGVQEYVDNAKQNISLPLDTDTIRAMPRMMAALQDETVENTRARRLHAVLTEHITADIHFDASEKEPGTVVVVNKALVQSRLSTDFFLFFQIMTNKELKDAKEPSFHELKDAKEPSFPPQFLSTNAVCVCPFVLTTHNDDFAKDSSLLVIVQNTEDSGPGWLLSSLVVQATAFSSLVVLAFIHAFIHNHGSCLLSLSALQYPQIRSVLTLPLIPIMILCIQSTGG